MLDINYIRENKEKVIEAAKNKNRQIDIEAILDLDEKRRQLIQKIQNLRQQRNILAKEKPTQEIIEKGKQIKNQLKTFEDELKQTEEKLNQ
ncbi:MAG: serine--tRNA ligase, partial [Microgenomates group bacterium]